MRIHQAAIGIAAIAAAIAGMTTPAIGADPVKIGLLEDQSGNFAIAVIPTPARSRHQRS